MPRTMNRRIDQVRAQGAEWGYSSGWSLQYLMGLTRATVDRAHIVAENGGIVQDPLTKVPHFMKDRPPALDLMEQAVRAEFKGLIWVQGNDINLTVKPTEGVFFSKENHTAIVEFFRDYVKRQRVHGVTIVKQHPDSVEVIPRGVDKGKAVKFAMDTPDFNSYRRKLRREEVAAIGDGETDEPMYKEVGLAFRVKNGPGSRVNVGEATIIGVEERVKNGVAHRVIDVPTAHDALAILLDRQNRWLAQIRPSEAAAKA